MNAVGNRKNTFQIAMDEYFFYTLFETMQKNKEKIEKYIKRMQASFVFVCIRKDSREEYELKDHILTYGQDTDIKKESFEEKAIAVHGKKYDYSQVDYIGSSSQ